MLFSEVLVFSPQDKQMEFQNGRTDKKGRFSFYPDCSGNWQITVKDEMGHSVNAHFNVTELKNGDSQAASQTSEKMPLAQGVATGIGIIFGIFGIMTIFNKRKKESI